MFALYNFSKEGFSQIILGPVD